MSEVKDFLQELKTLNNNLTISIFVPSQNREVLFKPFSAKQQKDIIKTVLSGIEGNISLTNVFNEIIEENSLEKGISYMLYDRNKIFIDLRKFSISESININNKVYTLNELPEYLFNFKTSFTVEYNNIRVECEVPSLAIDSAVTLKSLHEFYKLDTEDQKLTNSVNILLVYEIIKFIASVKINEYGVIFSQLPISDRKDIVDNLPLTINNQILEFISKYKQYEQTLLSFSDNATVTIDASFLSSE
jgi:hypothetical protein